MDINEKLDMIITQLEEVAEKLEVISEQQEATTEAISDLGLPGSGYSIVSTEE